MKKLFFILGLLFASVNVQAQLQTGLLPGESNDYYKCWDLQINSSSNGVWAWYQCDAWKKSTIGTPSRVIWIAAPHPIRYDLIGGRIQTIMNNADKLAAARKAWNRYVTVSPLEATMWLLKEDMMNSGVPIVP